VDLDTFCQFAEPTFAVHANFDAALRLLRPHRQRPVSSRWVFALALAFCCACLFRTINDADEEFEIVHRQ